MTNPQRTTGGKREEFTRVQQKDIDAALASLTEQVGAQFDGLGGRAERLAPGHDALPGNEQARPDRPVGRSEHADRRRGADTFQLGATATGTVVAVDTSPIEQVARQRIAGQVPHGADPAGRARSRSSTTRGTADGELVDFRVTAAGQAIAVLDPAALREEIKGKSVDEARSILGRYGTVTISTWPGFVSSIPTIDARLDLTVGGDGAASSPAPSSSAP